jgi:hypothetical protein
VSELERKFRVIKLAVCVSEGQITSFCQGCANLKAENSCQKLSDHDQAARVYNGWCVYAVFKGLKGAKSRERFYPYEDQ